MHPWQMLSVTVCQCSLTIYSANGVYESESKYEWVLYYSQHLYTDHTIFDYMDSAKRAVEIGGMQWKIEQN